LLSSPTDLDSLTITLENGQTLDPKKKLLLSCVALLLLSGCPSTYHYFTEEVMSKRMDQYLLSNKKEKKIRNSRRFGLYLL